MLRTNSRLSASSRAAPPSPSALNRLNNTAGSTEGQTSAPSAMTLTLSSAACEQLSISLGTLLVGGLEANSSSQLNRECGAVLVSVSAEQRNAEEIVTKTPRLVQVRPVKKPEFSIRITSYIFLFFFNVARCFGELPLHNDYFFFTFVFVSCV
jgi:hypothetical protein